MQFLTVIAAVFATTALAAPFDGNDAENVAADVAADYLRGREANNWNRPGDYNNGYNNGYSNGPGRWNNGPGQYNGPPGPPGQPGWNNGRPGPPGPPGWNNGAPGYNGNWKRDAEAEAEPQWNNGRWNRNNNNGWNNGAQGGNNEGAYQSTCTCTNNGQEEQWLGQAACNNLHSQYSNLYWDGNGCVDNNGQGVEYNGFKRACQGVGGAGADADYNVDAQCY